MNKISLSLSPSQKVCSLHVYIRQWVYYGNNGSISFRSALQQLVPCSEFQCCHDTLVSSSFDLCVAKDQLFLLKRVNNFLWWWGIADYQVKSCPSVCSVLRKYVHLYNSFSFSLWGFWLSWKWEYHTKATHKSHWQKELIRKSFIIIITAGEAKRTRVHVSGQAVGKS